jgi:hypothetical protein
MTGGRFLLPGARAALGLGLAASFAANVLAADPGAIGWAIAGWAPVALLISFELLVRAPIGDQWTARLRAIATAGIAGIAAWVSYWHMVDVALAHGESPVAAHLLPISVDGLVAVAALTLRELAGRPADTPSSPVSGPPVAVRATAATTSRPTVVDDSDVDLDAELEQFVTHLEERGAGEDVAPIVRRYLDAGDEMVADIGARCRRLAVEHPDWTRKRIGEAVGCSERTVRRHLAGGLTADAEPVTVDA